MQTLSKEESCFSDNTEDIDIGTLKTDTFSSIQEKGVLEKPEKEMTNLKKIKRTCYMEKDIVMSRYSIYSYIDIHCIINVESEMYVLMMFTE